MKPFSIAISAVCFVLFLVILLIIWLHPQKLRTRGPVFKVPCVPWIPVGSALFHCVLLFQLPGITWTFISGWLIIGIYQLYSSLLRRTQQKIKMSVKNFSNCVPKNPITISNHNYLNIQYIQMITEAIIALIFWKQAWFSTWLTGTETAAWTSYRRWSPDPSTRTPNQSRRNPNRISSTVKHCCVCPKTSSTSAPAASPFIHSRTIN